MLGFEKAVEQLIETVREHLAKFEPVKEPEARQAELVIQGIDLSAFTADKKEQLLDFIAKLTSADRSQLQIANLTAGSVHVFVDMPARAAYELKTLALNRDPRFKELGIVSLKLDGDAKYVNTSLGNLTLAATVGPLAALWLKIPALFSPVLGATAGKIVTISLGAALIAGAALAAPRALAPVPAPSPTVTAAPTQISTPTFTPVPTSTLMATLTPAPTQTATQMPTETATPSFTPTLMPTYALLSAEVINRTACRYGPGDIYLYQFGLIPSNRIVVSGRVDLQSRREPQTWLWGLPEGFPGQCWVNARDVKLDGDPSGLEVVYPDRVKLPVLPSPRWPAPQNVEATRLGDQVTISWDFFDVPLGERESEDSPRYVAELWSCQSGQVIFTPIPVYELTKVTVIDQAGCAEPSHGRIYLAEKHGYVGPVEIRWPLQGTPTP
jgi:hypothetical protein